MKAAAKQIEYAEIDAKGEVLTSEILQKLTEGITEEDWKNHRIALNIYQMCAFEQRGLSLTYFSNVHTITEKEWADQPKMLMFFKSFHFPQTEVWLLELPFTILRKVVNIKEIVDVDK